MAELKDKIELYRAAYAQSDQKLSGNGRGSVTLMLHTFIGEDMTQVKEIVRQPFKDYLADSMSLWGQPWNASNRVSGRQREMILDAAFARFFDTKALIGTVESCVPLVHELQEIGIDEIACLIDFGVQTDLVMESLVQLDQIKRNF